MVVAILNQNKCLQINKYVIQYGINQERQKMKCKCGLSFYKVDWLKNRVRGYCSIKCRKDFVFERWALRLKQRTANV